MRLDMNRRLESPSALARQLWGILLALSLVGASTAAARACPICMPMPQKTAADVLIESRAVVFARENPDRPFSYLALEILKGDPAVATIDLFANSATRRLLSADPNKVAVLCRETDDGTWRSLGVADDEFQQLVRSILANARRWDGDAGAERRCEFFIPLFGHEDRRIFELAYLELGRAPYATIKRIARSASRERVVSVLERREYFEWRPLAILMLAQSEEPADRRHIGESFRSKERYGLTQNLAAWATAAIEVEGAETVDLIEQSYFVQPGRSREELLEILKALSLHGTEGRTELRDQIADSYATLLRTYPDMGGYVAGDLAAWGRTEWSHQLLTEAATGAGVELGDAAQSRAGRTAVLEMRWSELRDGDGVAAGNSAVRLPGYVLPLATADDLVTEFLLVPYVGACIHTPPPPADQIVHVSAPEGVRDRGVFAPIWVTGRIEARETTSTLFLVDGSAEITAGYVLDTSGIAEYSTAASDALAEVEIPGLTPDHSWWQNMQLRVSVLFTRTMSGMRDRQSVTPLLVGLLVAFTYGVIHTLGPGHGKAVVVSYFVGEGGSLLRGIRFGTQIAATHVLAAIVAAILADFAIQRTMADSPGSLRLVRLISYGLITLIGSAMLVRSIRGARRWHRDHEHGHDCACQHLGSRHDSARMTLLSLAIGSVPCTGALIVLLYGIARGMLWPSVLMVIAISAGMAVALSSIGIAAILGRRFIEKRVEEDSPGQRFIGAGLRIAGASLVLLIGLVLFGVTLLGDVPPPG
jgi:ABC-type nickel/cobalt efflux system permease component RcnA